MAGPDRGRRRRFLLGAVAAAGALAWIGAPQLNRLRPRALDFTPIDDPPGFRRLRGGATSGAADPLAGLSAPVAPGPVVPESVLRADLCTALFGPGMPPGVTPIASFSDYACPYCRVLTRRLAAIEAESGGAVRVAWREWPLLGPASEIAARAALAAGRQGAYAAFHAALMRGGFVVTPALLDTIAARTGIDAARMRADMASAEVAHDIAESRGLARLFGFPGTPALVVGRTVVVGEIADATLTALIAREREDGPPPACR